MEAGAGGSHFLDTGGLRKEDWGKGDGGRVCPPRPPGPALTPPVAWWHSCLWLRGVPLPGSLQRLTGTCFPKRHMVPAPEAIMLTPSPLVWPWVRLLLSWPPFCAGSISRHLGMEGHFDVTFSVSLCPAASQMPGPGGSSSVLPSANISRLKKKKARFSWR